MSEVTVIRKDDGFDGRLFISLSATLGFALRVCQYIHLLVVH